MDKEDIESLGWKFNTDLYIRNNLTLQVHKDSITIKYYDMELEIIFSNGNLSGDYSLFESNLFNNQNRFFPFIFENIF